MRERRHFQFPNAWKFTHDRQNYYLKFDTRLAKKIYTVKKNYVDVDIPIGIRNFGQDVLDGLRKKPR